MAYQPARRVKDQLIDQLARFEGVVGEELLDSWELMVNASAEMESLDAEYHARLFGLEHFMRAALQVERDWLRVLQAGVDDKLPAAPLIRAWLNTVQSAADTRAIWWSHWFEQAGGLHLDWLSRTLARVPGRAEDS